MVKKYGPDDEIKIKTKKEVFNTMSIDEVEDKISELRKNMEE